METAAFALLTADGHAATPFKDGAVVFFIRQADQVLNTERWKRTAEKDRKRVIYFFSSCHRIRKILLVSKYVLLYSGHGLKKKD